MKCIPSGPNNFILHIPCPPTAPLHVPGCARPGASLAKNAQRIRGQGKMSQVQRQRPAYRSEDGPAVGLDDWCRRNTGDFHHTCNIPTIETMSCSYKYNCIKWWCKAGRTRLLLAESRDREAPRRRMMMKATAATMAMTPTMGSTVARATLPPWLSPLLLLLADCVLVCSVVGVVLAAGRPGATQLSTSISAVCLVQIDFLYTGAHLALGRRAAWWRQCRTPGRRVLCPPQSRPGTGCRPAAT